MTSGLTPLTFSYFAAPSQVCVQGPECVRVWVWVGGNMDGWMGSCCVCTWECAVCIGCKNLDWLCCTLLAAAAYSCLQPALLHIAHYGNTEKSPLIASTVKSERLGWTDTYCVTQPWDRRHLTSLDYEVVKCACAMLLNYYTNCIRPSLTSFMSLASSAKRIFTNKIWQQIQNTTLKR